MHMDFSRRYDTIHIRRQRSSSRPRTCVHSTIASEFDTLVAAAGCHNYDEKAFALLRAFFGAILLHAKA